jgi:hypothetical protein
MPISLDGSLGIHSSGNITSEQYYFGNGRFLTGINGSGGNGSAIFSGNSSVSFDSNGNAIININGANVASFNPGGLTVANGNVVAEGFFFANGDPVVTDLGNITTNLIPSLDLTYTLGNTTNQWKDLWVGGNTIYMYRIPINLSAIALADGSMANTLAVGGNPLVASNTDAILGNLTVSGNAVANAFLSDQYLWANGTPFISADGNLAVGNITSTGSITAAGNVAGANVTTPGNVIAGGNIDGGNINTVGTVTSNAVVTNTVTSNVVVTNTVTANTATISGNIDSGNVNTGGQVVAVGNVSGGNVTTVGNVSGGNLNASNAVVAVGNVSGGNLTTIGAVVAVGNVSGGNITTTGNVDANSVSANTVAALTITSGNVIATDVFTNAITSNTANIVGTITAGNVATTGSVTSTGNVVGGNIVTLGNVAGNNIVATGNVETDRVVGFAVTIESTGNAQGINLVAGPNGNINVNNTYINNLAMPLQDNDAANKAYVDLVASNLRPTLSVVVSTTASLTPYTYNNGTAGVGATITFNLPGSLFIGGELVTINQRVLIKDETGVNAPNNGIYLCTTQGATGVAAVLTRATDFDEPDEVANTYTFVDDTNSGWVCITPAIPAPVFGTTDIVWTQFSEAAGYQAGAGLSLDGQIFNANPDNNTIYVNGSNKIAVLPGANLPNVNIQSANITGGLNVVGNTTVSNITATGTTTINNLVSNTITSIGNISGGNIVTTGTTYTNAIVSNSTVTNGNTTTTGTTTSGNTVTLGTTTSNVVIANTTTTTGTTTSGNIVSLGNTTTAGNATSGNVISLGDTTTTGTATSGNTVTIGTTTTNAIVSNTSTTTGNATSGNVISLGNTTTAGTTTTNAIVANTSTTTGNATSGNVISLGNTTTTGTTTSGNTVTIGTTTTNAIVANTSTTTGNSTSGNVVSLGNTTTAGNTATGNLLSNGTVSSSTLSTTGNADIGGNLTSANFSTAGTANIGNLYVPGTTTLIGNATAGNLALTAIYTDGYFFANGVPFVSGGGSGNGVIIGNQQFVGDGSASYLLNQAATTNSIIVTVNGVTQAPITSYNVAGNTINFAGPIVNTSLVDIRFFAASGGNVDIYGDANVAVFLPSYTGNLGTANTTPVAAIFTDGYFYANGAPFSGGNYSDSNVEILLASGNLTSNIITSGNISGSYILGNGAFLTGIAPGYANANVTALLASGNVTSNIITTANVAGNFFIGNGSQLTGIVSSYGNANVETLLASGNIANNIVTTANVAGNFFIGNGRFLTGVISSYGNSNVSDYLASGNNTANIVTTGNVSATNFIGNGSQLTGMYGNANVVLLLETGIANNIVTTGNVTANVYFGNGSQLTGMYGNSNVEVLLENGIANNIITTGNVTANVYFGNGSQLTGMYGNANVSNFLASGNNTANIVTTANVQGANIVTVGSVIAGANVAANNVNATAQINAAGNITGGNIATAGTANVGNLVVTGTSNLVGNTQASTISASGNIFVTRNVSANSFIASGSAQIAGNVNAGNVNTDDIYGSSVTITATVGGIVLNPGGGNINVSNTLIRNVVTPVAANDAANKQYVDGLVQGVSVKEAVTAATATALPPYTYNNGNVGVGATITATAPGVLNIDGTGNIIATNDRVLIKDEVAGNAPYNGVYVATNIGNITAPFILTRSTDMDLNTEFPAAFIFVIDGNVNQSSGWTCTNTDTPPPTVGTTAITFSQFSYAGGYSAGNGMVLTGTQFSVNIDPETMGINGNNQVGVKSNANLVSPNIGNATFQSLTSFPGSTGNISANNIALSGVAEIVGNLVAGNINTAQVVANANITTAQSIIASGNILGTNVNAATVTATGNVTGGNLIAISTVYTVDMVATGNVSAGNLVVNKDLITTGNITANNLVAANSITANVGNIVELSTANVTVANVITAPVANLTDITASNITATTANVVTIASNTYYYGGNGLPVVFYANSNVADFLASGNLTSNIITSANVTAQNFVGNGAALTGMYGNANVEGLLSSGNVTGNIITAGNIVAVGNISGDYVLGNGRFLTGMPELYGNANVVLLLETGITSNIITTANISTGGILTDNIYYANGQPYVFSNYGNANVADYLASGNVTTNVITSGNVVTNLVTANLLTVNQFSNLGNISNITIAGGAPNYALLTDGAGNLSWGLAAPAAVPAVYFTALADGNGQTFSNVILGAYNNAEDINLFYNGALLESQFYTLNADTITVNTELQIGDTIDIARQVAGNINNITSGYGDSNVTSLLSGGITTDINTSGNIQGSYYYGNGALLTGIQTTINSIPAVEFTATANGNSQSFSNVVLGGYTTNTAMTVFKNGVLIGSDYYTLAGDVLTINTYLTVGDNINIITQVASNVVNVTSGYGDSNVAAFLATNTGNISAGYFLGDGSQLTGLPAGYTDSNVVALLSSGSVSSEIITTGNITGDYLIGNGSQLTGLPASYANANVNTYLNSGLFTGNFIPNGNATQSLGNSTNQWKDLWISGNTLYMTQVPISLTGANTLQVAGANVVTSTAGGNVNAVGNVNAAGMTITGNAIITGNASIQGTLTFNNTTSITTANLVIGLGNNQSGINVTGGGMVVGSTAEAQFLYDQPNQTWDSNLGITATGNVTAPYFIGDGSQLTGLPASYGNANVATLLASGTVSSNVITTGNIAGNYFIGNGSQLTGIFGTEDYLQAGRSGDVLLVGLGSDFVFNSVTAQSGTSQISVNTTTGVVSLKAGVTYNLTASPSFYQFSDTTGGFVVYTWVDAVTNTPLVPNSSGAGTPGTLTTAQANQLAVSVVYTPSTNQTVKVRVTQALGTATFRGNFSILTVEQIGVSAGTTSFTNLTVSGNITSGNVNTPAGQLLPATITTPTAGQILAYNGTAWVNSSSGGAVTGTWTLTPGVNAVSFDAPAGLSYNMFVNGNIPNGIIIWQATVTLSNTNVPVVGNQYGWYYNLSGPETLRLNAMPEQIVGTAGSIVTTNPIITQPSNRFRFNITNNSGTNQVVTWSYRQI